MPSTPSTRLRVELQELGENTNTWGKTRLNDALQRLDDAIAGLVTKTVTGDDMLVSTNYAADQARMAVVVLTGTPGATFKLTIPSVEKGYWVFNLTNAAQTIGTAGGALATVRAGLRSYVYCNGTDTVVVDPTLDTIKPAAGPVPLGGQRITGLAVAASPALTDAANVKFVQDAIASGASANLPSQIGNAGKYLTTDGTTPSWGVIDLSAYPTRPEAVALAIAYGG